MVNQESYTIKDYINTLLVILTIIAGYFLFMLVISLTYTVIKGEHKVDTIEIKYPKKITNISKGDVEYEL